MKKTFPILFLFIFLFNISGVYFIYILRFSENRSEMRAAVSYSSQDNLLALQIPARLIRSANTTFYHTSEDEISYNGKMYDVAFAKQNIDGSMTFYCLSDNREENLTLAFHRQADKDFDKTSAAGSTSTHKTGIKDFFKDYLPQHINSILPPESECCRVMPFCFLYYFPAYFKVPSPPPRQA